MRYSSSLPVLDIPAADNLISEQQLAAASHLSTRTLACMVGVAMMRRNQRHTRCVASMQCICTACKQQLHNFQVIAIDSEHERRVALVVWHIDVGSHVFQQVLNAILVTLAYSLM